MNNQVDNLQEYRGKNNLDKTFEIIQKSFFENQNYELLAINSQEYKKADIRFLKLEKIVYEKDIKIKDKILSVYSAFHNQNAKLILKLVSDGKVCNLYLGVYKINGVTQSVNILKGAIEGNLPGTRFEVSDKTNKLGILKNAEVKSINVEFFRDLNEISVVTGIPSLKDNDNKDIFIQGLENLVLGMQGKQFSAMFLAEPISNHEVTVAKETCLELTTNLSVLKEQSFNITENESISYTEGVSESLANSFSITEGKSITEGTNSATSIAKNRQKGIGGTTRDKILGTKNNKKNSTLNKLRSTTPVNKTVTNGKSSSSTINNSKSNSTSQTNGTNSSETQQKGLSKSLQVSKTNKFIEEKLKVLDLQIERYNKSESSGLWLSGVYFTSKEPQNSAVAASIYSGIIKGEDTRLENFNIKTFNASNKVELDLLQKSLKNYNFPVIKVNGTDTFLPFSNVLNTEELTLQMGLPQKSFSGVDVLQTVPFGSNLPSLEPNTIEVGKLFNYDKILDLNFNLDVEKFTGHIFVTGSTGSGKSNVTYTILQKLRDKKINFLVVEPAKGEYKDEFGGLQDVTVYGSNNSFSNILKINPFSFPEGVHIYEHIDRLIEILNASWAMEAAMPAMLKDAIEKCYVYKGWDLDNSVTLHGERLFPTFNDLAFILPELIDKSNYGEEIKSNYKGALVTRVNSMTNGLLRLIFSDNETKSSELFDKNVIVDLSKVPSLETKSLLMGVLFMKLQEHRIVSGVENNSQLKHVTLLEEAHNLLKKTSSEQNQSSANLQGKAVEMISNAIAEMRTYGQGFILADQAPGLLDPSAIRNTNTKICLRLPSEEDRELVGKSMNLTDEQIDELAKLRTGVAAVYQNNWEESYLCKFNRFEGYPKQVNNLTANKESIAKTKKTVALLLKVLHSKTFLTKTEKSYLYKVQKDKYYNRFFTLKLDRIEKIHKNKVIDNINSILKIEKIKEYLELNYSSQIAKRELVSLLKDKYDFEQEIVEKLNEIILKKKILC